MSPQRVRHRLFADDSSDEDGCGKVVEDQTGDARDEIKNESHREFTPAHQRYDNPPRKGVRDHRGKLEVGRGLYENKHGEKEERHLPREGLDDDPDRPLLPPVEDEVFDQRDEEHEHGDVPKLDEVPPVLDGRGEEEQTEESHQNAQGERSVQREGHLVVVGSCGSSHDGLLRIRALVAVSLLLLRVQRCLLLHLHCCFPLHFHCCFHCLLLSCVQRWQLHLLRHIALPAHTGGQHERVEVGHAAAENGRDEQILEVRRKVDLEDGGENDVGGITTQKSCTERVCRTELGQ